MTIFMRMIQTAGLCLSLMSPSFAADNRNYLVIRDGGESCLNVFNGDEVKVICEKSVLFSDERIMLNDALDANKKKANAIAEPKRDARTPLFNKCVAVFGEEYHYVMRNCWTDLQKDLNALNLWFGFTKSKDYIAAEQGAKAWMAEMEKISNVKHKEMVERVAKRRLSQTPLENAIDALQEPCFYADRNNIMRSCD